MSTYPGKGERLPDILCAWCGRKLGEDPSLPAPSHGICKSCQTLLEDGTPAELRAAIVDRVAGNVRTAAACLAHTADDLTRLAQLIRE